MEGGPTHVTKVLLDFRRLRLAAIFCLACFVVPVVRAGDDTAPKKPAEALYLQLGQIGLDPSRVYQVRGASLDRSAVHITLEDGTIGFTQDVMGRITGAFFEGDGEVLLTPPDDVERKSMSLFTGMAILEEHFATAYFRFNDDAAVELRPDLRTIENKQEFVDRWQGTARNLAQSDSMRLLMTFSRLLPGGSGASAATVENVALTGNVKDRFLHARLQGTKLGVFDVYFDSIAPEEVQAGQPKTAENGSPYYDVWTSFSPLSSPLTNAATRSSGAPQRLDVEKTHEDWVAVRRYSITTEVTPPKLIHSQAQMQLDVKEGGARALLFELSRFLQIESVQVNGQPVEFIQNPAIEGTQLSRRGNDIVAVILPEAARAGQSLELRFVYGGEVLAEAGSGLLYVGARGTWYPNRGMAMADFDLQFEYPKEWTLVATGKPTSLVDSATSTNANGRQTARWVSERPLPVAGFNLGKYKVATVQAGKVTVETYAAQGVEKNFPGTRMQVIAPDPADPVSRSPQVIMPHRPSPVHSEASVGEAAARAIQYYADRFGPYPYSRLTLTQMPGRDSQGWPGLVFLSSYAFLDNDERAQLHFEPFRTLLQQMIPAHETAHQWWGDLITWSTYRDQWFSEGLANYCALMMLQEKDPAGFRVIMEKYRQDLVAESSEGDSSVGPGPVTLGVRLFSSHFPEGYEAISYGRGTWLFHMLRTMMKDAETTSGRKPTSSASRDEPFVRALFRVREKYEGKSISTRELLDVFAEELPPALRYEGKSSLDWFMDSWVNGTALPKLEVKAVKFTPKGAGLVVTGTILQKDAPEDLVTSVPVYGIAQGKQSIVLLGRVFADGQESSFRIPAPVGIHKIVLDPNETVLTKLK